MNNECSLITCPQTTMTLDETPSAAHEPDVFATVVSKDPNRHAERPRVCLLANSHNQATMMAISDA